MNKKVLSVLCLLCLLCSMAATAYANSYTSTVGTVWFKSDGKSMGNDFQKNLTDKTVEKALKDRMRQMQPGDDVTFVINLRNDYSKATNWYMTNKIVDSLEEGTAADGAYTYYLRYVNNANSIRNRDIYRSDTVGGKDSEGLMEVNDALKGDYAKNGEKYFYLDNLERGQGGQILLTVSLDGETQGNAYQRRLADLKMNFAVQIADKGTTPPGNAPKTGDENNLLPYYIAMIISGLLFLYFALDSYTDRLYRKKGKGKA